MFSILYVIVILSVAGMYAPYTLYETSFCSRGEAMGLFNLLVMQNYFGTEKRISRYFDNNIPWYKSILNQKYVYVKDYIIVIIFPNSVYF